MKTCDFNQFEELAQSYNVVPMVREILADFQTPISMIAQLDRKEKFFLLESIEGGEKWGRFSILGFDIRKEFVVAKDAAVLRTPEGEQQLPGNPIDALQHYLKQFNAVQLPGLPRFFGGLVGYFSFQTVRFFERCGEVKETSDRFPDSYFMVADHLAVFDNLNHTVKLVCCVHPAVFADARAAYDHGLTQLERLETLFNKPPVVPMPNAGGGIEPEGSSNMTRDAYESMVRRAKEYIREGDIIQAVLAQHFTSKITADYLDVYRALRYINPSPYMFYLNLAEDRAIAGSSPEVMVRVTDDLAEIRPIAGTRPRGKSKAEDQALAEELLADPKERAEHVMLVDLARNDLGRVARIGSVNVTDYMIIERYSHVMHIVSQVEGRLREGIDALDVFKASFPAGTLSGAPKVRAMEIINELEPIGRGPYGGALGYLAYGGKIMDMAITIRTVLLDRDTATVTAGAGIVHDSEPRKEYEETQHKSRGMMRALKMAENHLKLGVIE